MGPQEEETVSVGLHAMRAPLSKNSHVAALTSAVTCELLKIAIPRVGASSRQRPIQTEPGMAPGRAGSTCRSVLLPATLPDSSILSLCICSLNPHDKPDCLTENCYEACFKDKDPEVWRRQIFLLESVMELACNTVDTQAKVDFKAHTCIHSSI